MVTESYGREKVYHITSCDKVLTVPVRPRSQHDRSTEGVSW